MLLMRSIMEICSMYKVSKQNYFPTLNSALESEGLLESWAINFPALSYDSTFSYTFDDGSKHGHYVSVYRDSDGRYERPVHYKR